MPKSIIVSDTTLRDGHQQPGLAFTLDERLYIASMLRDLGVDIIEAGFPANSYDAEPVLKVASSVKGPKISALARVMRSDIDAAYRSLKPAVERGDGMVHVFIGTSEMHQAHNHRKNAGQVQQLVADMVGYAKGIFGDVQFSPEDATRTDREFLHHIISTAISAGATRINIPDTVGYTLPVEFNEMIRGIIERHEAIKRGEVILSVHCHNDLDQAVANTLTGIGAGAAQFEGTINGLGERAGNTDLATVIMALRTREDLYRKLATDGSHSTSHINTEAFTRVASSVDQIAEMPTYPNRPITGTNSFRDSSGIHAAAVLRNPGTYHIMHAGDVGGEVEVVVGPTSGINIVRRIVDKHGYEASDEAVQQITEDLKGESIKSKDAFSESEAHVYIRRYLGLSQKEDPIQINSWHAPAGSLESQIRASVEINVYGERRTAFEEGVGAIDAVANSIMKALNGVSDDIKLVKFEEISVSQGTDSLAKSRIAFEYKGQVYWGRDRSPDIVTAGVNAMVKALNSIYLLNDV